MVGLKNQTQNPLQGFGWPLFPHWVYISILFILTSCIFTNESVSLSDPGLAKPLATFQGLSHIENDSVISSLKLQSLTHPKVFLVWQFLGVTRQIEAFGQGQVATSPPYRFNGSLMTRPPEKVFNSREAAIGGFWLYSDANQDAKFNDFYHPEHLLQLNSLDSNEKKFQSEWELFVGKNQVKAQATRFVDTLYSDSLGQLFLERDGEMVLLFVPSQFGLVPSVLKDLLFIRNKILGNLNKWDAFFEARKTQGSYNKLLIETQTNSLTKNINYYYCRLYSRNNDNLEFQKNILSLSLKYLQLLSQARSIGRNADKAGWLDYPYNNKLDKDWIVGRSKWYHVLYFPTQESLGQLLESEAKSNFEISNIGSLKLGYNLIHCDNRYWCKVLNWTDTIIVNLGEKFKYFDNPNDKKLSYPADTVFDVELPQAQITKLQGSYEIDAQTSIMIVADIKSLWCKIPGDGVYHFIPTSTDLFYCPANGAQLHFLTDERRGVYKAIFYKLPQVISAAFSKSEVEYTSFVEITNCQKQTGTDFCK